MSKMLTSEIETVSTLTRSRSLPTDGELYHLRFLRDELKAIAKHSGMNTGRALFKTINIHRNFIHQHGNVRLHIGRASDRVTESQRKVMQCTVKTKQQRTE
jgi:hypothetical protein